ncbi:MAG: hypothetical protein R2710_12895 [Acidimicrobiales bacterium]
MTYADVRDPRRLHRSAAAHAPPSAGPRCWRVRLDAIRALEASSELTLRYSDRELRRAFRSIQSPLATASGAIMFGLGLAVALLGLASLSLSAWPA